MKKNDLDAQVLYSTSDFVKSKNYWLEKLKNISTMDSIPFFKQKVNEKKESLYSVELESDLNTKILALCNNNPLSLYIYTMSIYSILMAKYTNKNEILIFVPSFNKNYNPYSFNELLPVVCTVNREQTFKQHLLGISKVVTEAVKNQHYPLGKIYKELGIDSIYKYCDCVLNTGFLHSEKFTVSTNLPFVIDMDIRNEILVFQIGAYYDQSIGLDYMFNHFTEITRQSINKVDILIKDISLLKEDEEYHKILQWSSSNKNQINDPFTLFSHLEQIFEKDGFRCALKSGDKDLSPLLLLLFQKEHLDTYKLPK